MAPPTTGESVGAVWLLSLALKLMLLPVSVGPGFATHCSWLAIVQEKPMNEWYSEIDASWDLTYPPVFAYLKYFLSIGASGANFNLTEIASVTDYDTSFVYFQRFTVIAVDQILLFGILLFCSTWPSITTTDMEWSRNKVVVVVAIIMFDPGLIMVDHIALNYTNFAIGLLIISISFIRRGDDLGDLIALVSFIVLAMFDQVFVYLAPLYITYLFRHYCAHKNITSGRRRSSYFSSSDSVSEDLDDIHSDRYKQVLRARLRKSSSDDNGDAPPPHKRSSKRSRKHPKHQHLIARSFRNMLQPPRRIPSLEIEVIERETSFKRCCIFVLVIMVAVYICFLPLILSDDGNVILSFQKVFSKLLQDSGTSPNRQSWAPNIWALYQGLDKLLVLFCNYVWDFNIPFRSIDAVNIVDSLSILPDIGHYTCIFFAVMSMGPILHVVWETPHPPIFIPALLCCMASSFMLGYEVPERHILFVVVPLGLTACDSTMDARLYILMSWIGHVSVLPLLSMAGLKTFKPVILCLHCFGSYIALDQYHIMARRARRIRPEPNGGGLALSALDKVYFSGLAWIYLLGEVLNPSWPFMVKVWPSLEPLANSHDSITMMIMSMYCAVGLIHCWVLARLQLDRKVALIMSYQWSPRHSAEKSFDGADPTFQIPYFGLENVS